MAATPLVALVLVRPLNGLITFASVLLGAWLGAGSIPITAWWAATSACLIGSFGNAHNDVLDADLDVAAHPDRPLPAGRISLRHATTLAWTCAFAGVSLSLTLDAICIGLAVAVTFLLFLYNSRLKWLPLVGNVVVAVVAATAFVYGGCAAGDVRGVLLIAGFAFVYHLARELVKDLQDAAADAIRGRRTLPTRYGTKPSTAVACGLMLTLVLITPLPATHGPYGWPYLAGIGLMDACLTGAFLVVWPRRRTSHFGRASAWMKAGMLCGLAAFVAGELAR